MVVRGPNVMRGYLGLPEESAQVLRGGWLHTGDVGRFDDDGYLTLVDRVKDMIIRGGENIYPKEIEDVLYAHPAVLEAAVVGQPDPVFGEQPVAFVALRGDEHIEPGDSFSTAGSRSRVTRCRARCTSRGRCRRTRWARSPSQCCGRGCRTRRLRTGALVTLRRRQAAGSCPGSRWRSPPAHARVPVAAAPAVAFSASPGR